jgi:hypothetical protein
MDRVHWTFVDGCTVVWRRLVIVLWVRAFMPPSKRLTATAGGVGEEVVRGR